MNIKIDERFKLNQSTSDRFDLIEVVTRQKVGKDRKPTGETYQSENIMGYDMSLENCIQKIVAEKLKVNESTVSLKEFLEEYKKEKEQLIKQIKLN